MSGRGQPFNPGRPCTHKTQEHRDSLAIVEFLMDHNGTVDLAQMDLARKLNMIKHTGRGVYVIDTSRFHRARNHLMDCTDDAGQPCCGYRIHYRKSSNTGSTLSLTDPSGDLGEHAQAAFGALAGWIGRERQHHTENQRQVYTFETLADHALANGDTHGFKLLHRAIVDLDKDGTVLPDTMAQLSVWVSQA